MTQVAYAYQPRDNTPAPLGEHNLCVGIIFSAVRALRVETPPQVYVGEAAHTLARAYEDVTRYKDGDPISKDSGYLLPFWIAALPLSNEKVDGVWRDLRALAARHAAWYDRYQAYHDRADVDRDRSA